MNKQLKEGGEPRSVEPTTMVRKPKNCRNEVSPYKGNTQHPTFNPCLVILALHVVADKQDLFCEKVRCKKKEQKEPNSTKLVFVKKWPMTGSGGNTTWTAIFECPRCGKRKRILNYGGAKQ